MTDPTLRQLVGQPVVPALLGVAAGLLLAQSGLSATDGYEDESGFHFGLLPVTASGKGQPGSLGENAES